MGYSKTGEDIRETWTENNRYRERIIKVQEGEKTDPKRIIAQQPQIIDPLQYNASSSHVTLSRIVHSINGDCAITLGKLERELAEYNFSIKTPTTNQSDLSSSQLMIKKLSKHLNIQIREYYFDMLKCETNPIFAVLKKGYFPEIKIKFTGKPYVYWKEAETQYFLRLVKLNAAIEYIFKDTFDFRQLDSEIDDLLELVEKRFFAYKIKHDERPSNNKTIRQFQKVLDCIVFLQNESTYGKNKLYITTHDLRYFESIVFTKKADSHLTFTLVSKSKIMEALTQIICTSIDRMTRNDRIKVQVNKPIAP